MAIDGSEASDWDIAADGQLATLPVLVLTALTAGLSAGIFFIFQTSITPGLALVDDAPTCGAFRPSTR